MTTQTTGNNSYLYKTVNLLKVVTSLMRPKSFLLDTAFTQVSEQETEEVAIDVQIGNRKVAPFVAPNSEGKIVERQGFRTNTFKPAYVKPKTTIRPGTTVKRAIGEQIGGGAISPLEREALIINQVLQDHADRIVRTQEVMASSALRTGTVTVAAPDYPTTVVDFGRDASLTQTLSGSVIWGQSGSTPLKDIKKMTERVHRLEGASITDIVMDPIASELFLEDEDVIKAMDNRRQANGVVEFTGALDLASGAKLVAQFGDYRFWSYSEFWQEEDGTQHKMLPSGTVLGLSPQIEGIRAFGAIMDSGVLQPMQMYPKSWVPEDPPYRILMTQSAPLVIPSRPNASWCLNVLGSNVDESLYI